jgi:hypothetical protein
MNKFLQEMARFLGVFGCIDGTHIRVQASHKDEGNYVNRKQQQEIANELEMSHLFSELQRTIWG